MYQIFDGQTSKKIYNSSINCSTVLKRESNKKKETYGRFFLMISEWVCKYEVMYALNSYRFLPMSVRSSRPAWVVRVAGVGGLGVHGNAFLPQWLTEGVLYVAWLGGDQL